MQTCDVLVIGAGIAGASAAYEIAAFAKVILLERESQPGYHTTGRSAAVFGPAYGNRVIRALTAASHALYREEAGGLADHPVLAPRGALVGARGDQLDALDALRAETAPEVASLERLDAAQVREGAPVLAAGYVAGGLYDPSSMDLDVAAIHQGYIKGLRARGGQVVTDAEVSAITTATAPWRVETRAGPFESAVLFNAAGAWADELAAMAGVAPLGLVPMRRTATRFQASIDADPAWPLVDDADEEFYFKPASGLPLGSPADETPTSRLRSIGSSAPPAFRSLTCGANGRGCAPSRLTGRPLSAWSRARPASSGWPARAAMASRPRRARARRGQAAGRGRAAGRSARARPGRGGSPAAAPAPRFRRTWSVRVIGAP